MSRRERRRKQKRLAMGASLSVGVALVGGETAEHPGLLGVDDYDVAGAAVGIVEADRMLGADKVRDGDLVIDPLHHAVQLQVPEPEIPKLVK